MDLINNDMNNIIDKNFHSSKDFYNDYKQCDFCKNKEGPIPGYYYSEIIYKNSKIRIVIECDCHKKFTINKIFKLKCRKNNIWPEAINYNPLHDYVGEISKHNAIKLFNYVENFEKYKNLVLYLQGPNGTQKTTLAQWVAVTLLSKNYEVKYFLMQNILNLLVNGYDSDEEKRKTIEELHNLDLIIIDEAFDKNKVTLFESGYQIPFLDKFLRERVEIYNKGIIFISNKMPEEIEKNKFSYSIQDFVIRNLNTSKGNTLLTFEDNYLKNKNSFNVECLFD